MRERNEKKKKRCRRGIPVYGNKPKRANLKMWNRTAFFATAISLHQADINDSPTFLTVLTSPTGLTGPTDSIAQIVRPVSTLPTGLAAPTISNSPDTFQPFRQSRQPQQSREPRQSQQSRQKGPHNPAGITPTIPTVPDSPKNPNSP